MEKKTIFKTMMVAACCLGAAVFASCDKDNDNNRSNGLRLSADRITVAPGATASVAVASAAQPLTVKSTDEKTATAKADKNTRRARPPSSSPTRTGRRRLSPSLWRSPSLSTRPN